MNKHGLSKHPLYKTWNNVTQRVKSHKSYVNISICNDWLDFINFYNWSINNGWKKELSIDRIDNLGDYKPSNCRWVTQKEQCRNTSRNKYFKYNGESLMIIEICEKYNLNRNTFNKRLRLGWSIDRIIETPIIDARQRMLGAKLSETTKNKIREKLKGNNNRIKNNEINKNTL